MVNIKFSHRYEKMPNNVWTDPTMLMQVFTIDRSEMSELFEKYDTLYYDGSVQGITRDMNPYFYELPKGKLLVLLLITGSDGLVWTTIRRWTPQKEEYYRSCIGQDVKIVIGEL